MIFRIFVICNLMFPAICFATDKITHANYDQSECLASLTSIARKIDSPFSVSAYYTLNKRPPAREGVIPSPKLMNDLKPISVSIDCYKDIDRTFKLANGPGMKYIGTESMKPISLFLYKKHYYLQLLYDYYWGLDEAATALAVATLIYDEKGNLLQKIEKSSMWHSHEGYELIIDSKITEDNISFSTLKFYRQIINKNKSIITESTKSESMERIDLRKIIPSHWNRSAMSLITRAACTFMFMQCLNTGAAQAQDSQHPYPTECPKPPKTISTPEGRIYECIPEEGEEPYRDVTPPDDKAHWQLPFGNPNLPPYGTGSYHPVKDWPFRAILSYGNPRISGDSLQYFAFDRQGIITASDDPNAIGNQMMEVRISGVRLWPTARIYYRLIPAGFEQQKSRGDYNATRIGDAAYYALVVDGDMLCPVLDESYFSEWTLKAEGASGSFLNGHCGEARRLELRSAPGADPYTYWEYPGFETMGTPLYWTFLRHDEPERPLRDFLGKCLVFCDK